MTKIGAIWVCPANHFSEFLDAAGTLREEQDHQARGAVADYQSYLARLTALAVAARNDAPIFLVHLGLPDLRRALDESGLALNENGWAKIAASEVGRVVKPQTTLGLKIDAKTVGSALLTGPGLIVRAAHVFRFVSEVAAWEWSQDWSDDLRALGKDIGWPLRPADLMRKFVSFTGRRIARDDETYQALLRDYLLLREKNADTK